MFTCVLYGPLSTVCLMGISLLSLINLVYLRASILANGSTVPPGEFRSLVLLCSCLELPLSSDASCIWGWCLHVAVKGSPWVCISSGWSSCSQGPLGFACSNPAPVMSPLLLRVCFTSYNVSLMRAGLGFVHCFVLSTGELGTCYTFNTCFFN